MGEIKYINIGWTEFIKSFRNLDIFHEKNKINNKEFRLSLIFELIYIILSLKIFFDKSIYGEKLWFVINCFIVILFHISLFSIIVKRYNDKNKRANLIKILFVCTLLRSLTAIYHWFFLVGILIRPCNIFEDLINNYYYLSAPIVYFGVVTSIIKCMF